MAAPKLPQQFGPYTLQELIARGGMAEVFRATMPGVGGFEKTVAIKKILPHLAENDEYMTMLIDEARIIVSINHANIAQVYDLGEIDGDYYLAMEYIHGIDLSTMVKELKDSNRTVPVEHALFITSGIAAGLHVAHNKCDETGRPINIVHRDVSPHNILISYAGDVKIIDFGVAKARGKEAHTQMGVIKGKLLYMAPEQAMAKDLDGRADLFAMGLILYRMLTNHLPFEGDNEFQIYNHILSKEIPPPRAFNPNIPEEVNQITMMLLQRDPSKRYQDGYAAKVDLDRALQTVAPGYSISRLSRWVETDFSHLIQQRQRAQSGQNDIAPSTPTHNQVHSTGEHASSWDGPDWDDVIDENEDTVNVAMDSPEALAVMERAAAERAQYQELRASGELPAPAAPPWAAQPAGAQQGQVPQSQQQWNQPAQPSPFSSQQVNVPPQFTGSGQWPAQAPPGQAPPGQAQAPYGSGQFPAPTQSGVWNQYPNQSGVFAPPNPYPQQTGGFAAPSGVYGGGANPSGYFAAPGQSGVYNLPPSPHYETFQPDGVSVLPQQEDSGSRVRVAVGILLVLLVVVGVLGWKLYGDSVAENDAVIAGTNGATTGATTGPAEPLEPEIALTPDAGAAPEPEVAEVRKVRLRADTTPTGASVFLGDELLGETPLDAPIPFGEKTVQLRFELEGYRTEELEAIPFADVRRKVELTPASENDTADAGGATNGGTEETAPDEVQKQDEAPKTVDKPKPKPKPKSKPKRRRTKTKKKPASKDPAVPLLLDDTPKSDKKSEVPVF